MKKLSILLFWMISCFIPHLEAEESRSFIVGTNVTGFVDIGEFFFDDPLPKEDRAYADENISTGYFEYYFQNIGVGAQYLAAETFSHYEDLAFSQNYSHIFYKLQWVPVRTQDSLSIGIALGYSPSSKVSIVTFTDEEDEIDQIRSDKIQGSAAMLSIFFDLFFGETFGGRLSLYQVTTIFQNQEIEDNPQREINGSGYAWTLSWQVGL